LKQLCAYTGLHVMSRMQKTTEPRAREQVSTMYQCGVCRTGKYIDHTRHMIRIYARPSWKRRVVRGKVDRQYWPSRMSESNLGFHQLEEALSKSGGQHLDCWSSDIDLSVFWRFWYSDRWSSPSLPRPVMPGEEVSISQTVLSPTRPATSLAALQLAQAGAVHHPPHFPKLVPANPNSRCYI